jgi:hypothetical protein
MVSVRRVGKEMEIIEWPADNHLGRNLDYFAKTTLEVVFKSVDAGGARMNV